MFDNCLVSLSAQFPGMRIEAHSTGITSHGVYGSNLTFSMDPGSLPPISGSLLVCFYLFRDWRGARCCTAHMLHAALRSGVVAGDFFWSGCRLAEVVGFVLYDSRQLYRSLCFCWPILPEIPRPSCF